jgi:exosortase/archaeosortase family protein
MVLKKNSFFLYLLKFLLTFCLLYYGTIALIGITAPGGYYSPFAARYLNYVAALRGLLLYCAKLLLQALGFNVYLKDIYTIKLQNGLGVHLVYSCIGYGVMIFWVSFIFANKGSWITKAKWITGGLLAIWIVNVLRIALVLIAINKKWPSLFNLDSHTLFNIVAYAVIFFMIYLYDRSQNKQQPVVYRTNTSNDSNSE